MWGGGGVSKREKKDGAPENAIAAQKAMGAAVHRPRSQRTEVKREREVWRGKRIANNAIITTQKRTDIFSFVVYKP